MPPPLPALPLPTVLTKPCPNNTMQSPGAKPGSASLGSAVAGAEGLVEKEARRLEVGRSRLPQRLPQRILIESFPPPSPHS